MISQAARRAFIKLMDWYFQMQEVVTALTWHNTTHFGITLSRDNAVYALVAKYRQV